MIHRIISVTTIYSAPLVNTPISCIDSVPNPIFPRYYSYCKDFDVLRLLKDLFRGQFFQSFFQLFYFGKLQGVPFYAEQFVGQGEYEKAVFFLSVVQA